MDHARGLAKLIRNRNFRFHNGWIHDIRKHVTADALRRGTSGNSARADEIRQVVETTREVVAAIQRNLLPQEPFVGTAIAAYPAMGVLGPSRFFYDRVVKEFMEQDSGAANAVPSFMEALAGAGVGGLGAQPLGGWSSSPPLRSYATLSNLLARPATESYGLLLPSLMGVLGGSSVKEEEPKTQVFNNTSTVIGVVFDGQKLLLTADAGQML